MTAAGVRQYRCVFCGAPCSGLRCHAHSDLSPWPTDDQWRMLHHATTAPRGLEVVLPPLYDPPMHAARTSEAAPARIGTVS